MKFIVRGLLCGYIQNLVYPLKHSTANTIAVLFHSLIDKTTMFYTTYVRTPVVFSVDYIPLDIHNLLFFYRFALSEYKRLQYISPHMNI